MPFSIIRQAPECAAVASCYCAKPPQTGCCGSSGTPKEKTTTAAVAAVATATAAAVSQFSLQGVPHASAAKLPVRRWPASARGSSAVTWPPNAEKR